MRPGPGHERQGHTVEIIQSFGTTTPDLLVLRKWLSELAVTHVAMESTGVYWKAPFYTLEDHFQVMLVNSSHVKHVPGRKTDTIDAAWLAQLLAHGLHRTFARSGKEVGADPDQTGGEVGVADVDALGDVSAHEHEAGRARPL